MSGKSYYKLEYEREDPHKKLKEFLSLLVNLFAGVIAGTIAWHRNAPRGEDGSVLVQVVMTVIAFLFGALYLIYFVGFVLMDSALFTKAYVYHQPGDTVLKNLADRLKQNKDGTWQT
jgi:hypothetical protein